MSHLPLSLGSGEPGTTGREVFEESTASGPAAQFLEKESRAHGTAGGAVGVGSNARAGGEYDSKLGGVGSGLTGGGLTGSHSGSHSGSGLTGGGLTGSHEGHHHHEGHQHGHNSSSGITPGHNSNIGDSYGSNPLGNTGRDHDRVGDLNQQGAQYDRTGTSGPTTGGAAGTDRFDADKHHDRSGVTGNSFGARDDYPVHDTNQRAEGKPSGVKSGIDGILGTSDKDFTGRERTGGASGAYANVDNNTHHPSGHTALTGREGNTNNNPVTNVGHNTGAGHHDGVDSAAGQQHKAGLLEKAKHAVGL